MKEYDPNAHAAKGSTAEAAAYLIVSVLAMIGAITLELMGDIYANVGNWGVAALFLVWLSGTTFTLGLLEYRRSQMPEPAQGPEV